MEFTKFNYDHAIALITLGGAVIYTDLNMDPLQKIQFCIKKVMCTERAIDRFYMLSEWG